MADGVKWYNRKLLTVRGKSWDGLDVTVAIVVVCLPVAFVMGLFLSWYYPGSSWWIMSVIAGIIVMAG